MEEIVATPDDREAWEKLFSFAPKLLQKPPRGGTRRNLTNVIKSRINKWKDGAEDPVTIQARVISSKKRDNETLLAKAITSKLEDGNFKAAMRLI